MMGRSSLNLGMTLVALCKREGAAVGIAKAQMHHSRVFGRRHLEHSACMRLRGCEMIRSRMPRVRFDRVTDWHSDSTTGYSTFTVMTDVTVQPSQYLHICSAEGRYLLFAEST